MKRIRFMISIALAVCALGPQMSLAQGYGSSPAACSVGRGGEGYVEIGDGRISITETEYVRTSPKRDLGDGWFEAHYAVEVEGEAQGDEILRLKVTPGRVFVKFAATGQQFSAASCGRP